MESSWRRAWVNTEIWKATSDLGMQDIKKIIEMLQIGISACMTLRKCVIIKFEVNNILQDFHRFSFSTAC